MDHTEEKPILAAPAADPDREARTKQEGSKRKTQFSFLLCRLGNGGEFAYIA